MFTNVRTLRVSVQRSWPVDANITLGPEVPSVHREARILPGTYSYHRKQHQHPQFHQSQNTLQNSARSQNKYSFFSSPSNLVFNHVIPQLRSIKTPMIIEVDGICIVLAVAVVVGNPNACYSTINALKPQNKASNALTARALDAVFQACRFRMQKCCALSKSRYSHYISRWPTKYPSCSNGGLLAGLRTSSPQHPILSTPLKQSTPSSH